MALGYVGVTVHRGSKVVMSLRTVKVFWTSTFYDLLEELVNTQSELSSKMDSLSPELVSHVAICKDQSFVDCQVTELNHELAVCLEFSSKYVLYNLVTTTSPQGSSSSAILVMPGKSVFLERFRKKPWMGQNNSTMIWLTMLEKSMLDGVHSWLTVWVSDS